MPVGTAAATFDAAGRYGNHTNGTSHAVIVTEWTPRGFWALQQYNIKDPSGKIVYSVAPRSHFYAFGDTTGQVIDNGSNYYVIQ